jgi:ribosomal protein L37AE/L43A
LIFSKCPRCQSERIRRGYRRTPIWRRAVGRYYLLCNACNWEFAGWAIPGTVEAAAARRRKKRAAEKNQQAVQSFEESNELVQKTDASEIGRQKPAVEETEEQPESVEDSVDESVDEHADVAQNGVSNLRRIKHKKRVRIKLNK